MKAVMYCYLFISDTLAVLKICCLIVVYSQPISNGQADRQLAGESVGSFDIDWNQSLYMHEIGSRDSDSKALQGSSASLLSRMPSKDKPMNVCEVAVNRLIIFSKY